MSPKSAASNASDNHEENSTGNSLAAKNSTGGPDNQLMGRQGLGSNNDNTNRFDGDQNDNDSGQISIVEQNAENEIKLHGIFHIGIVNRDPQHRLHTGPVNTFLLCRAFWIDHGLLTENCINNISNVLEVSFMHY